MGWLNGPVLERLQQECVQTKYSCNYCNLSRMFIFIFWSGLNVKKKILHSNYIQNKNINFGMFSCLCLWQNNLYKLFSFLFLLVGAWFLSFDPPPKKKTPPVFNDNWYVFISSSRLFVWPHITKSDHIRSLPQLKVRTAIYNCAS